MGPFTQESLNTHKLNIKKIAITGLNKCINMTTKNHIFIYFINRT